MTDIRNGPRPMAERLAPDEVERLVRLAGRWPAVPSEHAAVVKEAARAEWRRTVRARRRRQLYARGAGALLAAAALALLLVRTDVWSRFGPRPAAILATLEAATGPVTAAGGALRVGDDVPAGAVLETGRGGASPARAALRLAGGASLRLDAGTRLKLVSGTELELDRGAVYVDSGVRPSGGALAQQLEIRTPYGVVRDVGTRFEVRLGNENASLRVRVRDGEVILDRDGEPSTSATAGVKLTVRADGTVAKGAAPVHGPAWDWVLAILPPFELKDRTLRELLDWAAAEGGWTLRFADPALAERAKETVGGGSIDGLGLEQALSLVLPGFGLGHRLEDGVLVVEAAG